MVLVGALLFSPLLSTHPPRLSPLISSPLISSPHPSVPSSPLPSLLTPPHLSSPPPDATDAFKDADQDGEDDDEDPAEKAERRRKLLEEGAALIGEVRASMNQTLDLREFAAALCCRCSRPVLDPSLEQAARGFHQKREELGDVHPFMRWIGSEWEADLDLSAATASVSKWWGGGGNEKVVVDEETRRKLREVFDKVHTGGLQPADYSHALLLCSLRSLPPTLHTRSLL